MGLFDDLLKSIDDGKKNYEKEQEYKKKVANELEYYESKQQKQSLDVNELCKNIKKLKMNYDKSALDLRIKLEKTREERELLRKERANIDTEIREMEKIQYEEDDSYEDEELIVRYNRHTAKRIAFCYSYLRHPKATNEGKKLAINTLIDSQPLCTSIDEKEEKNLYKRYRRYLDFLNDIYNVSCLDLCFAFNLAQNYDFLRTDPESSQYLDILGREIRTMNSCRNTNEEFNLHIENIKFYKLSTNYSKKTFEQVMLLLESLREDDDKVEI